MEPQQPDLKIILSATIVGILLFGGVYGAFRWAKSRTGTIVLPGGNTYLGPSPTPTPFRLQNAAAIPIPADTPWKTYTGKHLPYSFSYPESLSLGFFPNDPYDSVTVFYGNTDSNTNIFFRVDDLTRLNKTNYIGKPEEYARNWWKDYSWNGFTSITPFTNSRGLSGWRARYKDKAGATPYDHVFFRVPGNDSLIIWISGRIFTPSVFDELIDSVAWNT